MTMHVTFDSLKTFYNILVQKLKNHRGNWNQNDPTADDYIKNRPFYSEGVKETIIIDTVVNFDDSSSNMGAIGPTVYQAIIEDSSVKSFKIGETYTVIWDGQTYECVAKDISGIGAIGNASLIGYMVSVGYKDTGEPFLIGPERGFGYIIFSTEDGSHTMVVKTITEVVHKLDKKFIDMPDDVVTSEELNDVVDNITNIDNQINNLSRVAFSGNYNELTNRPTIYTDIVRYNSQALSDAQKAQARANIGAFDGDYNNLTNKIASYGEFFDDWIYTTTLSPTKYHDKTREIYFKELGLDSSLFDTLISCDVAKVSFLNNIWYCKASTIEITYVDITDTVKCFGNKFLYSITEEDTGEPFLILPDHDARQLKHKGIYFAKIEADEVITTCPSNANSFMQLAEILIPDSIARVSDIPKIPEASIATEEYVSTAITESLSMFANDTAGQFAVSDGNGGIMWTTVIDGEDGEF